MAWQYPDVFGYAACMSSTFSHRDDLIDRVLSEPKSAAKFYLDSGWPGDNYEVTLAMAMALSHRGYRVREDFLHLAFPLDEHDERAWASGCTCRCSSAWARRARPAARDPPRWVEGSLPCAPSSSPSA